MKKLSLTAGLVTGLLLAVSCFAQDGIWKDDPDPEAATVSFYVQTYDGDPKSAVVIYSPQGVDFAAFISSDISAGVDAADVAGLGHHLEMTFTDNDNATARLMLAGESSTDYALVRTLVSNQGPPGPTYTGVDPITVDNSALTIGLNAATNPNDLLTWDGVNWVALPPGDQVTGLEKMQPYLGVNFVIAMEGIYPSRNAIEPFIGEIMMFAGNFAPRGWALCDGQLLAVSQYQALFSILGTTYGGDGRTTFALPDLRGRVPLHPGSGAGLTLRRLGEQGGSEEH